VVPNGILASDNFRGSKVSNAALIGSLIIANCCGSSQFLRFSITHRLLSFVPVANERFFAGDPKEGNPGPARRSGQLLARRDRL
jgi:hypothetical protein